MAKAEVRPRFSRAYFRYLCERMHEKPPRRGRWPRMHGLANQLRPFTLRTTDDVKPPRGREPIGVIAARSSEGGAEGKRVRFG